MAALYNIKKNVLCINVGLLYTCARGQHCLFIFPAASRLFQPDSTITSRTYLGLGQNTESTRNNTTQQNNHADF